MKLTSQTRADVTIRNGAKLAKLGVPLANDRAPLCWIYREDAGMTAVYVPVGTRLNRPR